MRLIHNDKSPVCNTDNAIESVAKFHARCGHCEIFHELTRLVDGTPVEDDLYQIYGLARPKYTHVDVGRKRKKVLTNEDYYKRLLQDHVAVRRRDQEARDELAAFKLNRSYPTARALLKKWQSLDYEAPIKAEVEAALCSRPWIVSDDPGALVWSGWEKEVELLGRSARRYFLIYSLPGEEGIKLRTAIRCHAAEGRHPKKETCPGRQRRESEEHFEDRIRDYEEYLRRYCD